MDPKASVLPTTPQRPTNVIANCTGDRQPSVKNGRSNSHASLTEELVQLPVEELE